MDAAKKIFKDIDEYIAEYPKNVQELLQQIRKAIVTAAPNAKEVISYNMPAVRGHRVLVYFAAHKSHIGFYPMSEPIKVFEKELTEYTTSKGAIQFPFEKGIPKDLVMKIVKYRVEADEIKRMKTVKK